MAKIVSNVATGIKWHSGVVGAVVGGAVYGGIIAATGNVVAAGFASAAAESLVNQAISYTKYTKMNGSKQIAPTKKNIIVQQQQLLRTQH